MTRIATALATFCLLAGCGSTHELAKVQANLRKARKTADPSAKLEAYQRARNLAIQGFDAPVGSDTAHCGYILAEMYRMGDPGVERNLQKARRFGEKTVKMLEQLRRSAGGHAAELRDTYKLLQRVHGSSGSITRQADAEYKAKKYSQFARKEGGKGFADY